MEKSTTVIELIGIRMTAKTGENKPCTAKLKPMALYIDENTKLPLITPIPDLQ